MKYALLFFALLSASALHAQKIAWDDDQVTVDGKPYCRLTKTNCKLGACDYHVFTLDSTEIIFIKLKYYNDPTKEIAANPQGRVLYFDWTFLGTAGKAETDQMNGKNIARALVDAHVIKDSKLDAIGERNFIAINGTPHTRRQEQLGLPVIIIER